MEGNDAAGMTRRPWNISRQSVGGPLASAGTRSIRVVLDRVFSAVDSSGPRPVLAIGNGDPTATACAVFRPPLEAEEAVVEALRSRKHNGYSPTVGVLPARRLALLHPVSNIIDCIIFV
jgi:tyrosine aminotransferase